MTRCPWAKETNPDYLLYHDEEWGVLVKDDRHLFEMLILEGVQAGLSWETVLKRRADYKKAYKNFDPKIVSSFDEDKIEELMNNPKLIRNRLKIEASVQNAKQFLQVQKEFGSFYDYLLTIVGKPVKNSFKSMSEVPAKTETSEALSKDLKRRGFNFVGPTIMYAFMQAVGLVNDHLTTCDKWKQL